MQMTRLVAILLLAVAMLCGCGATKAKPEAEAIVLQYFSAMKNGKVEDVMPLYSKEFFENMPKEKWKMMLGKINNKLGNVISYELATWNVSTNVGTGNSGTYVNLIYNVQYVKYKGTESFNMFKSYTGGTIRILGHNINSEGLLFEGDTGNDKQINERELKKNSGVKI